MFASLSRKLPSFLLWLLLLAMLGFAAFVSLKSCGLKLYGFEMSWCKPVGLSDVQRINELYRQVKSLEQRKRMLDQCRPARVPTTGMLVPAAPNPASLGAIAPRRLGMLSLDVDADASGAKIDDSLGDLAMAPGGAPPPGTGSPPPATGGPPPAIGGPPPAAAGPPPAPPPGGAPPPAIAPPPGNPPCPEGIPPNPYIVLALDHSRSMDLPDTMDVDLAIKLETLMQQPGAKGREASRRYAQFIDQGGRKRLDVLKDSVAGLADTVNEDITFGVVSFAGCGGVVDMGDYDAKRRPRMVSKVRALEPRPATPAALALTTALQKAARVPGGRVIFVSDGNDTCDADPCAAARRNDGVKVDVIAMGGRRILSCVAETTGGILIEAGAEQSVADLLLALGNQQTTQSCQQAQSR